MTGDEAKLDRLIGRTATTVLVTSVLVLGVTAGAVAWPKISHALGMAPPAREAAYRTGQAIDVPADWYRGAPHTLVLFARAGCGACQQAQPFFTNLVRLLKGRASFVLAGGEFDQQEDAAYARAIGLDDRMFRVAPSGLRVELTPTLVLVNDRGTVLLAWEGVGPPEQQTVIAEAIARVVGL